MKAQGLTMAQTMLKFLLLLLTTSIARSDEPLGCVSSVEPGVDLFTHKVEPLVSEFWDIEYYNTYKILTNSGAGEKYLLYQCGTAIPDDLNVTEFDTVVEIPVKAVGITETPMITFIEQLGARDKIRAYLGDPEWIWSPCFAEAVDEGDVAVTQDRPDNEQPDLVGNNPPEETEMVAFTGFGEPPFTHVIKVSENYEKTNAAIFEWAKFFAVFFNMEETANKVVDAAQDRLECVKEKATEAVSDAKPPTLLWGYYSNYCGGWDVGECPNYYCEFANGCGVEILTSTEGTNQAAIEKCGAIYMTTEEFVEFGKDADYWFFPSSNINDTLRDYGSQLSNFKSVQNKHVYDNQGMGEHSWFAQRFAEYYNVLEDMCVTVGTIQGVERRHFWRNVYKEQVPPDGLDGECTAETEENILTSQHRCLESSSRPVFAVDSMILSLTMGIISIYVTSFSMLF